jgi:tellurite resistance protein
MNKTPQKVPSAQLAVASHSAGQTTDRPAMSADWLPNAPASFFGMVLGLTGLGNAWRAATAAWHVSAVIGEALMAAGTIVWVIVVTLYALKWIFQRPAAIDEALHPVNCCFIGLGGVSTMLVALAALPYSHVVAAVLFAAGAAFTLAFTVWRTGLLWQGGRDHGATTPVLYLPSVAGGFVMAAAFAAFGLREWGQLAFGGALLTWLAIESVLMHRFYTLPEMPAELRATYGIQLAPPAVGAVAYYAVSGGHADMVLNALLGYAILQALILLRLLPWLLKQPFTASYWAYTFGIAALPTAPVRMIAHGDTGPLTQLAPVLFIAANIAIGLVAIHTIRLLLQGRLIVKPAAAR